MVVNLWKDRKMPHRNGHTKPMIKAANVGSRKNGQYFLIAFSILESFRMRGMGQPAKRRDVHAALQTALVGSA